jgi:hypothetical protein
MEKYKFNLTQLLLKFNVLGFDCLDLDFKKDDWNELFYNCSLWSKTDKQNKYYYDVTLKVKLLGNDICVRYPGSDKILKTDFDNLIDAIDTSRFETLIHKKQAMEDKIKEAQSDFE